jgi:hypothetical protein
MPSMICWQKSILCPEIAPLAVLLGEPGAQAIFRPALAE